MRTLLFSPSVVPVEKSTVILQEPAARTPHLVELAGAELYTSEQLAAKVLPGGGKFSRGQVEGALDEMTEWCLDKGHNPLHYRADVFSLIREFNNGANGPFSRLSMIFFVCRWILPHYDNKTAGFELIFFDSAPVKRGQPELSSQGNFGNVRALIRSDS